MKILMLARWLPVPRRAEEARREYRFARCLLPSHRLTLAFVTDQTDIAGPVAALRTEFGDIEFAVLPRGWRNLSAAVRVVTGQSRSVTYFRSEALRARVAQRLTAEPFDLVYVSSSSMMPYAAELDPRIPVVADFGHVDSDWWERQAAAHAFPAANFCRTEAARLRLAETAAVRRAAHCIAASPAAARALLARAPGAAVTVILDGVDEAHFAPVTRLSSNGTVAIVGRLDDAAGVEALARFCLTTVPAVKAARPDAGFLVASLNPPVSARRLADIAGIEFVTPPEDLRGALHRATLAVAPLPPARGPAAGIVEAMLTGLPVVATSSAAAGLGAVPDCDLVIEDNPTVLARQLLHLLASPIPRAQLAARGLAFARTRHSWEASAGRLAALIEATVPLRKPSRAIAIRPAAVELALTASGEPRAMPR
ncbi:MAG: glycosyltransferase [Candidatus Rokubacteria bacterium]|nr:glycosyltransferase [Candidatus Rokubacteria bacterium]